MSSRIAAAQDRGTGLRMLERDHLEISELLIELNRQAVSGDDPELQLRLLEELRSLSRAHFALEEAIMSNARYPGLEAHREGHKKLIDQLRRVSRNWTGKGRDTRSRLVRLAERVWDAHAIHMHYDDLTFGHWVESARQAG